MNRVLNWTPLLVGFLLYLGVALWKIDLPGPYFDELLFVDAASSDNPEFFIHKEFYGLPVLLMSYIGALKAWFYQPIFELFGVNIYSIRLPMIILGIGTLYLYFKILKSFLLPPFFLVVTLLLLASDPSFSFVSRVDWGPNAIAHFLLGLVLLVFIRYLKTNQLRDLICIFLVCLIGVFDKLNFIWFVSAFIFGVLIFYRDSLSKNIKSKPIPHAVFFLIGASLIVFLLDLWILPAFVGVENNREFDLLAKGLSTYNQLRLSLSAESIFNFIFAKTYSVKLDLILPTIFIFCLLLWKTPKSEIKNFTLLCLVIFLIIILQIWGIRSAGGPHHFLLVWPLPWLVIGLASTAIVKQYAFLGLAVRFWMLVLLILNFFNSWNFIQAVNSADQWRPSWSPAIYDLIEHLEQYPDQDIFCLDWGMGTPIKALAKLDSRAKIYDIWPSFWGDPFKTSGENLLKIILSKNKDLQSIRLIEYLPLQSVRSQVHLNLQSLLSQIEGFHLRTRLIHHNGYGYYVYSFHKYDI